MLIDELLIIQRTRLEHLQVRHGLEGKGYEVSLSLPRTIDGVLLVGESLRSPATYLDLDPHEIVTVRAVPIRHIHAAISFPCPRGDITG